MWFSSRQTSQKSNSLLSFFFFFFNASFLHCGFPTCIHCAAVSHVFMCGNAWQCVWCVLIPVSSHRYACYYSLHSFLCLSALCYSPVVGVRQTSPACWHHRQIGSCRLENGRNAGRRAKLVSTSPMYTSKYLGFYLPCQWNEGKQNSPLCMCDLTQLYQLYICITFSSDPKKNVRKPAQTNHWFTM